MTILVKQFFLDEVGSATSTKGTRVRFENVDGLNVVHHLEDADGNPFFLSECPDFYEYTTTIPTSQYEDFQNTHGAGIVTAVERTIDRSVWGTSNVVDVTYRVNFDASQFASIEVITQTDWDNEINTFDTRQYNRRLALVQNIRSNILARINDFVPELISAGVIAHQSELTQEFKDWRQAIVNLGSSGLPRRPPRPPLETHGNPSFPVENYPEYQIRKDSVIRIQYRRWFKLYEFRKIVDNDLDDPSDVNTSMPDE